MTAASRRQLRRRHRVRPSAGCWSIPNFLFRVETDAPARDAQRAAAHGGRRPVYRISDLELASRLSFFLWSSIPDDELLDAGGAGQAEGSGGARAAGAADAGRSALGRR